MSIITDLLSLDHIYRFAIVRHHSRQSVAEHSFNVAVIAHEIIKRHPKLEGIRLENVLLYAVHHDLEECRTGNLPITIKERLPRDEYGGDFVYEGETFKPGVTMDELRIVKLADMIDACAWISIHGLGSHAGSVTLWLKERLFDAIERYKDNGIDRAVMVKLVAEILCEEGRLFTV